MKSYFWKLQKPDKTTLGAKIHVTSANICKMREKSEERRKKKKRKRQNQQERTDKKKMWTLVSEENSKLIGEREGGREKVNEG